MDGRGWWQKVDRGVGGVEDGEEGVGKLTRSERVGVEQERSWMLNTASLLRVVAVWLLNENQRHGNVRFGLPCNWKHVSGETGRYRHQETTEATYLALTFVFDALARGSVQPGFFLPSFATIAALWSSEWFPFFGRIETVRRLRANKETKDFVENSQNSNVSENIERLLTPLRFSLYKDPLNFAMRFFFFFIILLYSVQFNDECWENPNVTSLIKCWKRSQSKF